MPLDESLPSTPNTRAAPVARPLGCRERIAQHGPASLGDVELVAVLLGTGHRGRSAVEVARHILARTGGLVGLGQAPVAEVAAFAGVGLAKAARIVAAAELGRRAAARPLARHRPIRCSRDVDAALRPRLAHAEREYFLALPLDARSRPLAELLLAQGSVSACPVDTADVFRAVLRVAATGVVFVHNHPSGTPDPSPEDIALTKRLLAGGDLLGIEVLDHVIIGHEGFFSFADAGLLERPDAT